MRTFEQAQEEAIPTPQEPTDFFASCFECKASWESFEELKQEFMALGGDGTRIPHCPRCLHDW